MPEVVSPPAVTAPLLNGEKLHSPAALAKVSNVPGHRNGSHINGSTIFRHIVKGVLTPSGERVRLEAVRVGSRWLTSLEALARFSAKLTEAALPSAQEAPPAAPVPTPKARSRAAARAHDELAEVLGANRPG